MLRPLIVEFSLLALLLAGCGGGRAPSAASPEGQVALAQLANLKASPHPGLQAELALLIEEESTPLALMEKPLHADNEASWPHSERAKNPPTARLAHIFPRINRNVLSHQVTAIYPAENKENLMLPPGDLERAKELLASSGLARKQFAQVQAAVDGGLALPPAAGLLSELDFLGAVELGCQLELLAAAVALNQNQPRQAMAPLSTMLLSARHLAAERQVTLRLAAGNLRRDALRVVGAIAIHPQTDDATREQLHQWIAAELRAWPGDANAWLGDRANGLIAYELVRAGNFLSLLDAAEAEQMEKRGVLAATAKAAMAGVDEDQLFYLRAMRRMIEACDEGYHERRETLAEIRRALAEREDTAQFPIIAGKLLLTDFEQAHRKQAEDLAWCQAWQLALAAATGHEVSPPLTNPLTGGRYKLEVSAENIVVRGIDPAHDRPILLPIQASSHARRRMTTR